MTETPCPTCGHCPTCGRSNASPKGYVYPYYPWVQPYWGPYWGTFTDSGHTTFTSDTTAGSTSATYAVSTS